MSFLRSTTLRASTIARSARCIRSAKLQPWQRALQRRTYASGHGHAQAKTSNLPWVVGSATFTTVGLYLVLTQDLSHGEGHGDAHGDHHEEPEKLESQPEEVQEDKSEEDKPDLEPKEDNKKDGGAKTDKDDSSEKEAASDAKEEDLEGEKNSAKQSDIKEDLSKQKGEEPVHKTDDDKSSSSPDESDKPAPRKPAGSSNETSGKQQGLSNDDTKHTANIHDDPQKSKKGEGVAETAKLKGTVSTNRPGAENKEERGKAQQDKDE